jgi:photosystem II stability/assembly factor-like uncharacterized protein
MHFQLAFGTVAQRKARRGRAAGVGLAAALWMTTSVTSAAAGSWQSIARQGGAVVSMAVAPADPSTVYATDGARLWKTVDAGARWNRSDSSLSIFPQVVAVDPREAATVYAGGYGGVAKSTDGGVTWTANQPNGSSGASTISVTALVIDPHSPDTIYVATDYGVFKSVDGAASWLPSNAGLAPNAIALAIDPSQPTQLYASTIAGIFRSLDAGLSWQPAHAGMGTPYVSSLVVDPLRSGRVYAVAYALTSTAAPRVWVSSNGGDTWSARPPAGGFRCLVPSAVVLGTVYACTTTEGLFQSKDAGEHWAPINVGLESRAFDVLAIAPSLPSRFYAGVSDANVGPAIYQTSSSGASWRPASSGFGILTATAVAVHPSLAGKLYLATGYGVLASTNDGATWTAASRGLGRSPSGLVMDPATPTTLYADTALGFFSTTDGGALWSRPRTPFSGFAPLIAAGPPLTLYSFSASADSQVSLWKSLDGGATWNVTDAGEFSSVTAFAVAPSSPTTLYLSAGVVLTGPAGPYGLVFEVSHDGGASFDVVSIALPIYTSIVVDPTDPNTVYAYGGALTKSTDGGQTFSSLASPDLAVTTLAIDPAQPSVLYAGAGGDVLVSRDSGSSWGQLAPGLPTQRLPAGNNVTQIAFGPGGDVYALVDGELFRLAP